MREYIFRCWLSLGDVVLLTAAVRDLRLHFPGRYRIDVRTCFPGLWANNPHLTPLAEYDSGVRVVDCVLPLINRSHAAACHSIYSFIDFFNQYLGTSMKPTAFRGDIHVSGRERAGRSQVHDLAGADIPFWLISAGGKYDCTIKWWETRRYQEVVDHFRGRIQFVQVGDAAHWHPKLRGVIDLRGRTSVRDLVRLVYHSQGVLCGVTGLMHLAAAVPVRRGRLPARPCVAVAGGRESPHWEAYPGHQFIHTVGALPCCAGGGCWKARTAPLGDGDERDGKEHLCVNMRHGLPRCMDMISSAEVVRRIQSYFDGGAAQYLSRAQAKAAAHAVAATANHTLSARPLNFHTAPELAGRFIENIPSYPGGFAGRGIIICGGGVRMFTNAWVCIRMLRRLGCSLPVQLWHWGERELDDTMRALVTPLGVECVDVGQVQREHPARLTHVWALKPYAVLNCRFQEVLLLDADNVPVAKPEFLFDTPQFRRAGAVFWPDYWRLGCERTAWKLFGVPYHDEPEFETGQVLVNKEACWLPLNLCLWYNEHSDLYYQHVYGDKETFHMAFRKLNTPYARPSRRIHRLRGVMCQHDFEGRRLFQHRNGAKWNLFGPNRRIRGFWFENECRQFLKELAEAWDGQIAHLRLPAPEPATGPGRNVAGNRQVRVFACMLSCRERESARRETLTNLASTDWADRPVHIQMDEEHFSRKEDDQAYTAWRGLQAGLQTDADYVLFLVDDLEFNHCFFSNLRAWPPLRRRQITVASLLNPGFLELARIPSSSAMVADPRALFAAKALLISRRAVRFFLEHWSEGPAGVDLKLGALSARLDCPVLCHRPSLVRPAWRRSIVGGRSYPARDFKRDWQAPEQNLAELVVVASVAEKAGHE
ncbi:MAG: glycosyltransferase family 9 protein [Limisphaerales bacterium]